MDVLAMWIGYAVMALSAVAATISFAWWVVDMTACRLGYFNEFFQWYGDKLRKKQKYTPAG